MPIDKLPIWLDKTKEVTEYSKPRWFSSLTRPKQDAVFYLWCIDTFNATAIEKGLKLTAKQLAEITGNAAVETGHGQDWKGNNWGGVKINKPYTVSYFNTTNDTPKWFKAEGHVAGGDAPIVYYIYFETPQKYAEYWLDKFVPYDYFKEDQIEENKKTRYYKTAKAFWNNFNDEDNHWFYELCVSGYKGDVTKKNPKPSVDTLFSCTARVKTMTSQLILETTPDGVWGLKSKEACIKFQVKFGIKPSGELDDLTFQTLLNSYFTLAEYSKNLKFQF